MSALITMKFHGDTAMFRLALTERADEFEKFSGMSQAAGAIHHRFGVDDDAGIVVCVDEWETAGQFWQFFSDPGLQAFITDIGADSVAPEITITEAVFSPDQF